MNMPKHSVIRSATRSVTQSVAKLVTQLVVVIVISLSLPTPSFAGIPVIDSTNLSQNTLSATEEIAQTLKQFQQYSTQLSQYSTQLQQYSNNCPLPLVLRLRSTRLFLARALPVYQHSNVWRLLPSRAAYRYEQYGMRFPLD